MYLNLNIQLLHQLNTMFQAHRRISIQ